MGSEKEPRLQGITIEEKSEPSEPSVPGSSAEDNRRRERPESRFKTLRCLYEPKHCRLSYEEVKLK